MKSKQTKRTAPELALVLAVFLATLPAGSTRAVDRNSAGKNSLVPPAMTIDPNTGLPEPSPAQWKDPSWKDPDKVLAEVSYDGLPLTEIARQLRNEFKDAFDVLIPPRWEDNGEPSRSIDPQNFTIKMQLKNVTASEVFNAMNLVFETENAPLRWQLIINGRRPTAVLRVLPTLLPPAAPHPEPELPKRMIYFVGDLVADEKSGGLSMEQLVKIVSDVYQMSYGVSPSAVASPQSQLHGGGHIQFHKEAQLLVVTGTGDQITFVQNTLSALRQKAQLGHKSQPKTKPKEAEGP